jgi:hypothetical protein
MARKQARPSATNQRTLDLLQTTCRVCGSRVQMARHGHRKVTTLDGVYRLTLKLYRCGNPECPRFHQMCRPEEEGGWTLPHGEFGLDVIALVGVLRYHELRSIPQIHEELRRRGLQIAQRTVTDQLYRYEELLALHLADSQRLRERLKEQQQVILALDDCSRMWDTRCCGCCATAARGRCSWPAVYWEPRKTTGPATGGGSQYLPEAGHSHRRSDHRWTTLHPQRGGACSAGCAPPVVSFPLSARSRHADCQRRPACQERTQETRAQGASD